MSDSRKSILSTLLLGAALALAAPACGDDEGGGGERPKRAAAKKSGGGGGKQDKKSDSLGPYTKVEDVVADEAEAKALRHVFQSRDFESDPTGSENRDPFRSYVVHNPAIKGDSSTIQPTEVCTAKNMVATNRSLRDLRLIGIVLRGTRSYSLFRDNAGFGHIVKRGDCLGKEKARVERIGTGFVRLEIVPEVSPNAAPRPPQMREIQLYPEELDVTETLSGNDAIEAGVTDQPQGGATPPAPGNEP